MTTLTKYLLSLSLIIFLTPTLPVKAAVTCDIDAKLETLLSIKDNLELSAVKKQAEELSARHNLLSTIFTCSSLESKDLKSQLEELKDLNKVDSKTKEVFLKDATDFIKYYEDKTALLKKIGSDDVKIKSLASDVLTWRDEIYNPRVDKLVDFIFILKQQTIINTTDDRLNKIKTSLNRIIGTDNHEVNSLLKEATNNIISAKELREKAYLLFSTTTPASLNTTASSTPEVSPRDLIKDSLTKIKDAYANFFSLSKVVKNILGF